jgi:hypothetical protein
VQLSPFSRYFIPLRSKYPPQHPVLQHPQSVQKSHISHFKTITLSSSLFSYQGFYTGIPQWTLFSVWLQLKNFSVFILVFLWL